MVYAFWRDHHLLSRQQRKAISSRCAITDVDCTCRTFGLCMRFHTTIHPKLACSSWNTVQICVKIRRFRRGFRASMARYQCQLWSVLNSFLPTDPLAKDTAVRNNCRIERQPSTSTRYARGFDLSANGRRRLPMATWPVLGEFYKDYIAA
jgi:hypothetical protein